MFGDQPIVNSRGYQLAIVGLLVFSAAAFLGSIWVMVDFLKEQAIVEQMREMLPLDAKPSATALAGELRWQFRLSLLVLLNLIATMIGVVLLWRAYSASQESLRDVKVMAGDILGSVEQAVITTDNQGIITSINRRGLEQLDASMDVLGKPITTLSNDIGLSMFRDQWKAKREPESSQDFRIERNGNLRILRATCQPLGDPQGRENGQVIQLRDVTERVLIEERMRRMERYMALGSLAAGLHHEIKNPLAALSLHIQLIEEQFPDGKMDDIADMLRIVKGEIVRIGCVLEGFRDFASIGRLNLTTVNPIHLVQSQVELTQPRAEKQNVILTLQHPLELPQVQADRVRMEQVLLNLLVNALEAMPNGGSLSVQLAADTRYLRITVTDSGSGIPDDLRERIFDPYFTTKGEGTGLGLALCDKIVRQHSGSLDFQSRPGETTFVIALPLEQSSDELPG